MTRRVQWSAKALANACQGRLIQSSTRVISGAFLDTRAPRQDGLFIAIVGQRDGHDFLRAAVLGGAAACLVARGHARPDADFFAQHDVALIEVDDTVVGLTHAATQVAASCTGPRIVITGSNGKTTTRSYIGAVVALKFDRICETVGNLNNHLGVPLCLLNGPDDPQAIVLELGMSAPGENAHLAAIVSPTMSVVTSIALEHLETMGSLENIARAEAEPIEFLQPPGWILLPQAEPLLVACVPSNAIDRLLTFGDNESSDCHVTNIELGRTTKATLRLRQQAGQGDEIQSCAIELQAIGRHNARNAAAALLVAQKLAISLEQAAASLAAVAPVGDRSRLIEVEQHTLLADCYNSNPGSVAAALATLAELARSQQATSIAVLGDMLELGPTTLELHQQAGELAAQLKIDHVIAVGPLSQATAKAAASLCHTSVANDPAEAAQHLRALLASCERCAILVKGSRGMRLEQVVAAIVPSPTAK